MAEKKKCENMRIMSLDGSKIYRYSKGLNGLPPLTAMKDGKLNEDAFDRILDDSLDTRKLVEVYEKHQAEVGYPFLADKVFCRAVVNVSFNYAVKEYEQYGRRYVKYGYMVTDEDMIDHACVRDDELIAIEVPYDKDKDYAHVENPIPGYTFGRYFVYDKENRAYRLSGKTIPSAVKTGDIREYLYTNGFDIDGIHYVRYKRSAGSSRDGRCYLSQNRCTPT